MLIDLKEISNRMGTEEALLNTILMLDSSTDTLLHPSSGETDFDSGVILTLRQGQAYVGIGSVLDAMSIAAVVARSVYEMDEVGVKTLRTPAWHCSLIRFTNPHPHYAQSSFRPNPSL